MSRSEPEPEAVIERALVRIRRDQQARQLQRRAGADGSSTDLALNAARFRYLDALEGSLDGQSISAIAEAIGVDRPRASRLTTDLLADGLIVRQTSPQDSRYVLVKLTVSGSELIDAVHEHRRRSVADALSGFTPREARTLAGLLERFVGAWPRTTPDE